MAEFTLKSADQLIAERTAGEPQACAQTCDWCCHQLVIMTNREDGVAMLSAARASRSADGFARLEVDIRAQHAEISRLSYEEAEVRQWTCPFLEDQCCTIYDARPIACRSVFSSDSSCCEAMTKADKYEDLSDEHQELATEIGERAIALQIEINDLRPITGAEEMRALLVEILDSSG